MPKAKRYRELEIRDKIISFLQNDDYIKSLIEVKNFNTKTVSYPISKLPITDQKINVDVAISVCFLGYRKRTTLSNNKDFQKGKIHIFIFYQNSEKEIAIDNCYEIALDIENTLKYLQNADILNIEDIYPIKSKQESKYTHILCMELNVCPHLTA